MNSSVKYDFPGRDEIKIQIREILISIAKERKPPIYYSALAAKFSNVFIDGHDARLHHVLGDISIEENENKKGLLSALVVTKEFPNMPGDGKTSPLLR